MTEKIRENRYFLIAGLILLCTCFFSKGFHQNDEHFQLLEFASMKLGITPVGELAWEYTAKMRPAIQVYFIVAVYNTYSLFFDTPNPFTVALILRVISAILALYASRSLYYLYKEEIDENKNRLLLLFFSCFTWILVYNGVRFSSENWSAIFFVFGYCTYLKNKQGSYLPFILSGILLGLSFAIRYQIGFMIFGLGSWTLFVKKERINNLVYLLLGFSFSVGLGVLADWWFYDDWIFSPWNYLDQNIFQNKAANFGVQPWWYYFQSVILNGGAPLSLFFVIGSLFLILTKPKSSLTWSIFPFILCHIFIGHKETRFLFPLVYFLPLIVIHFINDYNQYFSFINEKLMNVLIKLSIAVNIILLITVMFKAPNDRIKLLEEIYDQVENNQKTTVLYIDKHPMELPPVNIFFYRHKQVSFHRVLSRNDLEEASNNQSIVVYRNEKKLKNVIYIDRLLYSSYPSWIEKINWGDWLSRTDWWCIADSKNFNQAIKY